jgi:hypothetical protein
LPQKALRQHGKRGHTLGTFCHKICGKKYTGYQYIFNLNKGKITFTKVISMAIFAMCDSNSGGPVANG